MHTHTHTHTHTPVLSCPVVKLPLNGYACPQRAAGQWSVVWYTSMNSSPSFALKRFETLGTLRCSLLFTDWLSSLFNTLVSLLVTFSTEVLLQMSQWTCRAISGLLTVVSSCSVPEWYKVLHSVLELAASYHTHTTHTRTRSRWKKSPVLPN